MKTLFFLDVKSEKIVQQLIANYSDFRAKQNNVLVSCKILLSNKIMYCKVLKNWVINQCQMRN